MVKYGRKFFFDTNYIKKDKKLTIIIIITVILLIGTTFIITGFFNEKSSFNPNKKVEVYEEITIKIFEEFPSVLSYFKTLENVKYSDIQISYPDTLNQKLDFSKCTSDQKEKIEKYMNGFTENGIEEESKCLTYLAGKAGSYNIEFTIGKDSYRSSLKVIDDVPPVLVTKNVEIFEDEHYNVDSFVESCSDNSEENCSIKFLNTSIVDYSIYKDPGDYQVKIAAYDGSNNQSEVQTASLTIKQIIYHTVSFNSDGGTPVEAVTIRDGEKLGYPKSSTKTKYEFLGWYFNGSEFDFETPITSDITLTAKWKKIETPKPVTPSPIDPTPKPNNGGGSGGGSGSSTGKETYLDISCPNVGLNYYDIIGGKVDDKAATEISDRANEIVTELEDYGLQEALELFKGYDNSFPYTQSIISPKTITDKGNHYICGWNVEIEVCACEWSCKKSCDNAYYSKTYTMSCFSGNKKDCFVSEKK